MILNIYILFWIYSILGWCVETFRVSLKNKKIINRGFFLGPYCPIYGTGGIALLSLKDYQSDPIVAFILAIFICSVIEYLVSYFMELIYKVRWWDYSNRLFNINGRICLFNSFCFGIFGLLTVCYLNPYFINLINNLNNNFKLIIAIIILIITTIDMTITFSAMFDFRKYVTSLKDKTLASIFKPSTDSTEEISKRVRNSLKEKSFIHKHLLKAFANLKVYRDTFFKKGGELIKYRRGKYIENSLVLGTIISIIIALILGILFNNISLWIIISFVVNLVIVKMISRGRNDK